MADMLGSANTPATRSTTPATPKMYPGARQCGFGHTVERPYSGGRVGGRLAAGAVSITSPVEWVDMFLITQEEEKGETAAIE